MRLLLLSLSIAAPCLAQATLTASGTVAIELTTPLPSADPVPIESEVHVALACSATSDVKYALESMTLHFAQAPDELDGSSTLDSEWRVDPSWDFTKEISSFGARLVPHIKFACMQGDHQHLSAWTEADGAPITTAPRVLLPRLEGNKVIATVLAEPRGPERISLRVWGGGADVSSDFASAKEALAGVALPAGVTGMVHVSATLKPYGAVSNELAFEIEAPVQGPPPMDVATRDEPNEPKTGCSTAVGLTPLAAVALLWRRRKKE